MGKVRLAVVSTALAGLVVAGAAEARDWPEIPPEEKALKEVEGFPNAPAVMLLDQGILSFSDRGVSSSLEIYSRFKILNEEGLRFATISLPSWNYRRLKDLEGRTHLPDGTIVDMPEDAKFEKEFSTYFDYEVHSFALPVAEVGSIVEFRYRLFFDTFLDLNPWYFQGPLPTLRSEIVAEYPNKFGFAPVKFSPYGQPVKEELEKTPALQRFRYWMENLPPVPDEPYRLPFDDLTAWALFLPQEAVFGADVVQLLTDWPRAIELTVGEDFRKAHKGAREARSRAKQLAGTVSGDEAKAQRLYELVRDEVAYEEDYWVGRRDGWDGDKVLKEGKGTSAEQASLLHTMLDAAKVDSQLGWVRPRSWGRVQKGIPNPGQFSHVIVVAEVGGQQVFLDPTDPELPYGQLPPHLQGVDCLLVGGKEPQWITTPTSEAYLNERFARLHLQLGEDGAVEGTGNLWLTGHFGWQGRKQALEGDPLKQWQDFLEERFEGFEVSAVEMDENLEEGRLRIGWRLQQSAAEVLGDEAEVPTSMPLGLTSNPFSLPPGRRRTPVQIPFPRTERVEVHLTWPEGWEVEGEPQLKSVANGAGNLDTLFQVKEGERKLVTGRALTVAKAQHIGREAYVDLHNLYTTAAASDAEVVLLVKEEEP